MVCFSSMKGAPVGIDGKIEGFLANPSAWDFDQLVEFSGELSGMIMNTIVQPGVYPTLLKLSEADVKRATESIDFSTNAQPGNEMEEMDDAPSILDVYRRFYRLFGNHIERIKDLATLSTIPIVYYLMSPPAFIVLVSTLSAIYEYLVIRHTKHSRDSRGVMIAICCALLMFIIYMRVSVEVIGFGEAVNALVHQDEPKPIFSKPLAIQAFELVAHMDPAEVAKRQATLLTAKTMFDLATISAFDPVDVHYSGAYYETHGFDAETAREMDDVLMTQFQDPTNPVKIPESTKSLTFVKCMRDSGLMSLGTAKRLDTGNNHPYEIERCLLTRRTHAIRSATIFENIFSYDPDTNTCVIDDPKTTDKPFVFSTNATETFKERTEEFEAASIPILKALRIRNLNRAYDDETNGNVQSLLENRTIRFTDMPQTPIEMEDALENMHLLKEPDALPTTWTAFIAFLKKSGTVLTVPVLLMWILNNITKLERMSETQLQKYHPQLSLIQSVRKPGKQLIGHTISTLLILFTVTSQYVGTKWLTDLVGEYDEIQIRQSYESGVRMMKGYDPWFWILEAIRIKKGVTLEHIQGPLTQTGEELKESAEDRLYSNEIIIAQHMLEWAIIALSLYAIRNKGQRWNSERTNLKKAATVNGILHVFSLACWVLYGKPI